MGAPRTAEVVSFFRGVTTGLLLIASLTAARGSFARRCQRVAAPNTSPRVGRPGPRTTATARATSHAQETRPYPPRRPFKAAGSFPEGKARVTSRFADRQ